MFEYIRADLRRVFRNDKIKAMDVLRLLPISYGLHAVMIYRFGRWLGCVRKHLLGWFIVIPFYPIYALLSAFARKVYGINLEQSADIAAGLYIDHFGGIEVRNCRIGSHCNISQQVKLGSAETTQLVIGDKVYIGAHAQLCTDVTVEDGATIGAGAVVIQDIPHDCLVLGNPARITQRNYDHSEF